MAWGIGLKREDKKELTVTTPQVSVTVTDKTKYYKDGSIKSEEKSIKIEGNPSHVPEVAKKVLGESTRLLPNNSDRNGKNA